MVWPILTCAAVATAVAFYFYFQARLRALKQANVEDASRLREAQEEASAQSVARQEALFNSMAEGVLVLDQKGRIELANRAFLSLFGVTAAIRSLTVMEALRLHELADIVASLQGSKEISQKELKLSRPSDRWLEVNGATLVDSAGQPFGSVLVFHDLTRLKQMESARRDFVANVSHELRTPLSLIKGYAETLLDGAKDSADTAEKFLRIIHRNTDRLQVLIEDLLLISEVESGRVSLNLQSVSLAEVVGVVINDFQAKGLAKQVRIINEVPDLVVWADPGRLEQVFSNLLDNAIKYGRAGGAIYVTAKPVEDGMAKVSVQDEGPGIPAESLDRIFERFYRLDKARSREQGGTGLGLAIVKHIVQSHGGRVWAVSRLGTGSTFHFTIPLELKTAHDLPPVPEGEKG